MREACLQLGEKFYGQEQSNFENLITILHDHEIESEFSCATHQAYKDKINAIRARGGNYFMPVFRRIMEIIKEHPKVTDVFIMFVSDGQDTFSGMLPTDPSCQSILEQFKSMSGVETTFLTVGLSAHHDAAYCLIGIGN